MEPDGASASNTFQQWEWVVRRQHQFYNAAAVWLLCGLCIVLSNGMLGAQTRYATSDNLSGYVHWIDLYDAENNRIDPTAEYPAPYSPEKTCGRCHDFNTISHGWHFDAVDPGAPHGRPGQPWIWSDHRTGTHLPLSYRGWRGTHNPDLLGLTRWQVAAKFGGFLPGGGVGSAESLAETPAEEALARAAEAGAEDAIENRAAITGPLPIDCLLCHRTPASGYSPFAWTEQIEDQNFAYAPTAALGIAEISGNMTRLKDFDPTAEDAAAKLPKVSYDLTRFRSDGKVFIDLVRKPLNNSCYYCHTNLEADSVMGKRWLHDEDVHLRAGVACVDCHRNGLDHQTVRGYENEPHPAGAAIKALSCQGCHLGAPEVTLTDAAAGRLGAPRPAHRGLPPVHFEKMSCTACHSGPLPQPQTGRQLNSLAHRLGAHVQRTGLEFPAILGPVNLPTPSHPHPATDESTTETPEVKYTPHRLLWPSYWAQIRDGKLTVLNPEVVYELIRRPLKVRRDFTEELGEVSLSLSERKTLLGEDRARVKEDDRTAEEQELVRQAETKAREAQVTERVAGALAAIEEAWPAGEAVYVTAGVGFMRAGEEGLKQLTAEELQQLDPAAAAPYAWPLAHNVRPATQSLGVGGCADCHSDQALFFHAEVTPVGLLPEQVSNSIPTHELQQADMERLSNWNKLFAGRTAFKIASLVALAITSLITLSALAWNLGHFRQRTQ